MRRSSLVAAGVVLLGVSLLAAEDKKLAPEPGKAVPVPGPFQAWMATGKYAGRYHAPVCEFGLHPMVLVFTRDLAGNDQGLGELLKKLDQSIAKHPGVEPGGCLVFLTDGGFREAVDKGGEDFNQKLAAASPVKEEAAGKLQALAKAKELANVTLGLAPEAALNDYKLDDKAAVTVLICHQQSVLARYDLPREQLNEQTADKIAGQFEQLLQTIEKPKGKRKK